MKNTSQKGAVISILIGVIVVLIGVLSYMYFVPVKSELYTDTTNSTSTTVIIATPTNNVVPISPASSTTKLIQNEDFKVAYPGSVFSAYEINQTIPPNYDFKFKSIKLIDSKRAGLIGKTECMYGLSGNTSECSVEKEAGISFFTVPAPISIVTKDLTPDITSKTTIAGKDSISYKMGAEGSGIEYYYIPVNSEKTLVVIRMYREDGFPGVGLLNEILTTLQI